MPLDDRDRNFEKALGKHLRTACPDTEILASYHERALPPGEMILWKKHIAGCAACQEVLSGLEASENVSVEGELELAAFGHLPEEARATTRGTVAGAAPLRAEVAASKARAMPRRAAAWRWAAPVGAIAAGLLVFAAVTEMRRSEPVLPPAAQIASKTAPAAPPAAKSEFNRLPTGIEEKERANARALASKAQETAHASRTRENAAAQPEASSRIASQDELSKSALDDVRNEIANGRLQAKVESKDEEVRKKAVAGFANGPAPQSVQQQMANQQKQTIAAEASVSAPPAPAAVPRKEGSRDDKAIAAGALSGGTNSAQLEEVAPSRRAEFLKASGAASLPFVSSPDHQSLWRLGPNGTISYSPDQAGHWESQTTGVTVELTAGSAPNSKVCWVVGKQGTILRTVTAGHEWLRVNSPIPGDIGAIQASDALHARIWDAGRKASYETSDGGKTWTHVSGE